VLVENDRTHTEAEVRRSLIGDAEAIADHVCLLGYSAADQISIFSATSMASST
jgi:hypothetical protein